MRERLSDEDWALVGQLERPYAPLTAQQAETFVGELLAEVSEGHVLHGVNVQFLARRLGYDDFLAYAPDLEAPWASVHLSWKPRETPPWPSSVLYASFEEFLAECD